MMVFVREDIALFFDSYRAAFDALDAAAIAGHYSVPSVLQDANGAVVWNTPAEVLANMEELVERYRSDGYDHATAESHHVIAIGRDAAFVDVSWTIHRAEGAAPRQFHTAYNLRRVEDGWRITVCTAYEETR